MLKRSLIKAILAALACAICPIAQAQYPVKPVRIIVTQGPGVSTDIIARGLADRLQATWNQPVVVENKVGANGIIGADFVAKSDPGGYTLMVHPAGVFTFHPALYDKLPFDVARDFAPISKLAATPIWIVVNASLPVKSVKDLVTLARGKPNTLDYSSAGTGTMSHMAMEMLRVKTGTRITHLPYKGAAPATVALLTGEAQVAFVVMPVAAPHIASNRLRGLGVADKVRSAVAPNVPTMIEAGVPDHVAVQWNGLLVPSKTPQAIQDKLYKEWVAAVKAPEVVQRIRAEGAEPSGNTPAEFSAFFRAEAAKWADVAKQSGTTVD